MLQQPQGRLCSPTISERSRREVLEDIRLSRWVCHYFHREFNSYSHRVDRPTPPSSGSIYMYACILPNMSMLPLCLPSSGCNRVARSLDAWSALDATTLQLHLHRAVRQYIVTAHRPEFDCAGYDTVNSMYGRDTTPAAVVAAMSPLRQTLFRGVLARADNTFYVRMVYYACRAVRSKLPLISEIF